jgi:hypothetical protein
MFKLSVSDFGGWWVRQNSSHCSAVSGKGRKLPEKAVEDIITSRDTEKKKKECLLFHIRIFKSYLRVTHVYTHTHAHTHIHTLIVVSTEINLWRLDGKPSTVKQDAKHRYPVLEAGPNNAVTPQRSLQHFFPVVFPHHLLNATKPSTMVGLGLWPHVHHVYIYAFCSCPPSVSLHPQPLLHTGSFNTLVRHQCWSLLFVPMVVFRIMPGSMYANHSQLYNFCRLFWMREGYQF